MANVYTKDSIESLTPLQFTRLKPGVYCGNTTYSTQLLIEIFSNAVDEFNLGHGNVIDVEIKGDVVKVTDQGQGFLVNEVREDGKTVLEAAFSVLNTSGKYREDGTYEGTSLGSFGIGSKITTFLSHWLDVITCRDGKCERLIFKEGELESREVGGTNYPHGTIVEWQPSEEFFTHTEVNVEEIKKLFETIACLCKGLTINLTVNGEKFSYFSKNGLSDYVDSHIKDKEIISNRLNVNFIKDKYKLDLVMSYTSNYNSTIIPYVNMGLTESGPHITMFKTAITREFNKFFRDKKILKDKDENLTGEDIQEGMYLVFNLTAPNVKYDAQVKSRIVGIETKEHAIIFSEALRDWLELNEKSVKVIAEKALTARKAREAAKKAREAIREPKKKGLKAKLGLSDKLIECTSKNVSERSLLLVEGLSAGSAAIEARDPKRHSIMMLKGKTVSVLKATKEKVLGNQEYHDIITTIGAGFAETFDVSKMKYDKIVITSDADSDGSDIELLLITFFFTYMRPLVETGKLYRAITPLYIVKEKGEELYFYTEEEMTEYRKTHAKPDVLRAKGLGELNATDLKRVCFEKERFKRITVSDAKAAEQLLEILQGSSVEPRKKYIYENAHRLGFNFN